MHPHVPENKLSPQEVAISCSSKPPNRTRGKMIKMNEEDMCQQDPCGLLLPLVKIPQVLRHQ